MIFHTERVVWKEEFHITWREIKLIVCLKTSRSSYNETCLWVQLHPKLNIFWKYFDNISFTKPYTVNGDFISEALCSANDTNYNDWLWHNHTAWRKIKLIVCLKLSRSCYNKTCQLLTFDHVYELNYLPN